MIGRTSIIGFLGIACLLLAPFAQAGCKDKEEIKVRICSAESPWRDFSSGTLYVDKGDSSISGTLKVGAGLDFQLSVLLASPEKKVATDFLMIEGQALMLRGDEIHDRFAFEYMDTIVVRQQMPITILDLMYPKGPAQFPDAIDISLMEEMRQIDTATMTTGIHYGAPWHAKGKAKRRSASTIEFDIEITYRPFDHFGKPVAGPDKTDRMKGTLVYDPKEKFPDSMTLDGWRFLGEKSLLSPEEKKQQESAKPAQAPRKFANVGELRKAVVEAMAELEKKRAAEKTK